ncbi:DnaJ C-terminal domain-containing protein [Humitalea sp. 24SJ18S-53]|uniref:DnaJ C-terminal domain-containing protein n=1 Tax=Humitalea sp. 24SJ18S-53 TaxID=3422307 RepID=UPI003D67F362
MADDPYKVLGLARDATPEAIKAAYRKLARKHHPDLNPGKPAAEALFKAASAANDLLSDPDRRAAFDRGEIDAEGQPLRPTGGYRQQAEGAPGERYRPGGAYGAGNADVFEDLFADMFEARRRAEAAPRRGQDQAYRLAVPFLSAALGATEHLTMPDGHSLAVKIPPGVVTGQILRLRGKGAPGRNGGPDGDAMIELDVAEHPVFKRDGMDLRVELPVTIKEAVLGGPVTAPTPSGPVRVTLPPHSDTGRQIRLRGRGIAKHGDRAAGDLFLTLKVVTGPPDAALEAFLKDWEPDAAFDPRAGLEAATT